MKGKKKKTFTSSLAKKQKANPFERLGNKRTRRVAALNDRVKGSFRDVAKARAKSESRRKAGLLADLARERRENEFIDRRIGADLDESRQSELRFQKAAESRASKRQKQITKNEEEPLTHSGKALGLDDDFEEEINEEEREVAELDEEFAALAPLLAPEMIKRRQSARKYMRADDYDMTLRELMSERRAQATEPAWSREEVARRELLALDNAALLPTECPGTSHDLEACLKQIENGFLDISAAFESLRIVFSPRLPGRSATDFGNLATAIISFTKQKIDQLYIDAAATTIIKMAHDAPREIALALKTELLDTVFAKKEYVISLTELCLLRILPRIRSPRALLRRGIIILAHFLARIQNDEFFLGCLACLVAHELEPHLYLPEVQAFLKSAQPIEPITQAQIDWLKSLGPQESKIQEQFSGVEPPPTIEPRIEHRLMNKHDAHLDGPTAQLKHTKRLLNRERRGAMRELRRDADFLHSLRSKQQNEHLSSKRSDRQKNHNWIQDRSAKGWQ